jgi:hypothetical protein
MTSHRKTCLCPRVVSVVLSTALLAAGVAELNACSDAGGAVDERSDSTREEIIGGVNAASETLDAIGSLALEATPPTRPTPATPATPADGGAPSAIYRSFCSAALIGGATAVTAKHCVRGVKRALDAGAKAFFGIGADANAPKRRIEILDIEEAPLDEGGWPAGSGSDVGVVHLAQEVTDITPLTFAKLEDGDVGTRFVTIGYGQQDTAGTTGTRKAGTATLRALSGKIFELYFGNFEAFAAWAKSRIRPGSGPGAGRSDADRVNALHTMYDQSVLLAGYQALAGGQPGDAQACFGDSGAPLVRRVGDDLVAYGVDTASIPSGRLPCDYGNVYATFGPTTVAFLESAKLWTDPCAGVPSGGACEGTVAARCMAWREGPRRVARTDCATIGQSCGFDEHGTVGCVEPE